MISTSTPSRSASAGAGESSVSQNGVSTLRC
jgi:hypothetical protein